MPTGKIAAMPLAFAVAFARKPRLLPDESDDDILDHCCFDCY